MVSVGSATQVPELVEPLDDELLELDDDEDEVEDEEPDELVEVLVLLSPDSPPHPATRAAVPADTSHPRALRRSMRCCAIICRSCWSPRSCSSV